MSEKKNMILVEISKEQVNRAENFYEFKDLKGSITRGKGNIYGALGEIIIYDIAKKNGFDVALESNYDHDLIIEGYKIEVKTKRTSVEPKPNYLCSISAFNTKQKCDFYFFLRIKENLKTGYILGYKNKSEFFEQATFNKRGSLDVNGWDFKDDCYNLKIENLNQFKTFKDSGAE